jgi:hypothetical protein
MNRLSHAREENGDLTVLDLIICVTHILQGYFYKWQSNL